MPEPIAAALAFAIRRAIERQRSERDERRAKLTVVDSKRGDRVA